jgi:hypothetical protein
MITSNPYINLANYLTVDKSITNKYVKVKYSNFVSTETSCTIRFFFHYNTHELDRSFTFLLKPQQTNEVVTPPVTTPENPPVTTPETPTETSPALSVDEAMQNYIQQISYTIAWQVVSGRYVYTLRGTFWLISRIGTTGYKYYMATNMHVAQAVINGNNYIIPGNYNSYVYHASNIDDFNDGLDNESKLASLTYDPLNKVSQYYSYADKTGADYAFVSVDFGNAVNTGSIKENLDAFNAGNSALGLPAGKIKGVKTTNTPSTSNSTPKYIGGYPSNGPEINSVMSFEMQKLTSDSSLIDSYPTELNDIKVGNNPVANYTCSPGLFFDHVSYIPESVDDGAYNFLNHGASGSAIIDQDYYIRGIYFGGLSFTFEGYPNDYYFTPSGYIFPSATLFGYLS